MQIAIIIQFLSLKMHLHLNQLHFLFILSLCFPSFFCQNNSQYQICLEPFDCGRLRNISFPFWGGSRPHFCGYPGFELNCDADLPLLNISSLSYRLLDINFSNFTLKVARQDLWNNTCPQVLHNTTLDADIFEIPQNSTHSDVTLSLYYGCADNRGHQIRLPNRFNCDVHGVSTVNFFDAGEPSSSGPGSNITCNTTISVPVNRTAAEALETPANSSINVLQSALAGGFLVQWSADNENCQSCQRSGGTCVYDPVSVLSGMPPAMGPEIGGNRTSSYPVMPSAPAPFAASTPKSSGRVRIIIGVILGITCVFISATVIVCCLKRRRVPRRLNQENNKVIETFLQQHVSVAPKRFKYSEVQKITKSFSDKLGKGGYGSVYRGNLSNGSLVAVKVLVESDSNGEEFINEVASISMTCHVNIVNLLGFCYEGNKRALVYEYMPNKSLDKFISNRGSADNADYCLDLEQLYQIGIGIAKGLEYLHTGCTTRIVHFDIKPQNILLDEDLCPKISDFGLAKLCKKKQSVLSVVGTRGTIGYIAPEVFSRNFGGVSHKSDVYSYGMMVLEMAGAGKFIEPEEIQSSENYFADRIYEQVVVDITAKLDDLLEEGEEETRWKMFLVGFWCIQTNPSDRPAISKVLEMLEGSLQSIQIPPKPYLFAPVLPNQEISSSFSAHVNLENSVQN